MAADWSALPGSALVEISNRLPSAVDYIRFRSVCAAWRSAAPKRPHLPLLACCYAVDRNDAQQDQEDQILFLLVLKESQFSQFLPISKLPLTSNYFHDISLGSSHGWMFLIDGKSNFTLWNPITKARIQPPPLSSCILELYRGMLSSDPSSDPDCIVLAMYRAGMTRRMAFCRPGRGHDAWTTIRHPESFPRCADDAVFYNGRFYFLCKCEIYVWNVEKGQLAVQRIPSADPPFDIEPALMKIQQDIYSYDHFLVESDGDLLIVLLEICYELVPKKEEDEDFEEDNVPCLVEVFKLGLREQKVKWLKLESLGDRALFVGYGGQSISLTASNCPGCLANCVYVVGNANDSIFRVFSLANGSTKFVCRSLPPLLSGWLDTMWFSPSLLSGRVAKVDSFGSSVVSPSRPAVIRTYFRRRRHAGLLEEPSVPAVI